MQLPVLRLPDCEPLTPTAPASLPALPSEPLALPPSGCGPIPPAAVEHLPPSTSPDPSYKRPTESTRIIELPEDGIFRADDQMAVDSETFGTRRLPVTQVKALFGVPRVITLPLLSGPADDYGVIPLADAAVISAQVWVPNHATGEPYETSQEMIHSPTRGLRIGIQKGLISGSQVDVVLVGVV